MFLNNTGILHFIVLCFTLLCFIVLYCASQMFLFLFVFTNLRQDSPPAKQLQLALMQYTPYYACLEQTFSVSKACVGVRKCVTRHLYFLYKWVDSPLICSCIML